jgi:hypothetical protein
MTLTVSTPKAPKASRTGIPIWADTSELTALAKDLRRASPEAWKECRKQLRAAGFLVANDAKGRLGYSTRIPASIKVRTTASGNVKVRAGGDLAPNAAPIENKGKGFVRHPVFGDRERWTEKNSHPAYLGPALDAHREEILTMIEDAVFHAVERAIDGVNV